jgi:hypothetical protein
MVSASPVTPNVILIIDQSSSMNADFGDSDRWNALRDSLLARPDGLIASLESQVQFGLTLYSAISDNDGNAIGECPMLTNVDLALNNYDAINRVYGPADWIEDTPTGDAIDAVLDRLLSVPDPDPDPTIFIVATDGEPDRCEELDPQNGQGEAIAAVDRAFENNIRTYIISVGRGVVSAEHLQDMANAGLGGGAGDAPYWEAGDDAGLRDALTEIVGGVLSCEVRLEGTIDLEEACTGSVSLNGRELGCDDPNGWRAISEDRIEIMGTACDELQSEAGSSLQATFPCNVVII